MAVEFYWRMPMHGCHSNLRKGGLSRGDWSVLRSGNQAPGVRNGKPDGFTYVDHLAEIAKSVEMAGFRGALMPSFPTSEEAWMISSLLARETRSLRFMIAFQPAFMHPWFAARMAATLQRIACDRIEWNVVTGSGGPMQHWYGDFVTDTDRYDRTMEFLDVVEAEFRGFPFTYGGRFYKVQSDGLLPPLSFERKPRIYLAGASESSFLTAVKHADVHLSWLESTEAARKGAQRIRAASQACKRPIGFGIRVDLVARPTEQEAWNDIALAWETMREENKNSNNAKELATDNWQDLILEGCLWSGMHFFRKGPRMAVCGSYTQVAKYLAGLIDLGVTTFILAGTPHLEEAFRVGSKVLPLVRKLTRVT
jgi:alkanesulfonate monooxygenase